MSARMTDTEVELFKANERIAYLEAKLQKQGDIAEDAWSENEKLEAENERWTLECRELHRTIAKIHEEYRPEVKDAERLEWAKNNPRQFYEICQETLMSNVDEDVAIDAAREGE